MWWWYVFILRFIFCGYTAVHGFHIIIINIIYECLELTVGEVLVLSCERYIPTIHFAVAVSFRHMWIKQPLLVLLMQNRTKVLQDSMSWHTVTLQLYILLMGWNYTYKINVVIMQYKKHKCLMNFLKFIEVFHHQTFALYSSVQIWYMHWN